MEYAPEADDRIEKQGCGLMIDGFFTEVSINHRSQEIISRHRLVVAKQRPISSFVICQEFYHLARQLFCAIHQPILRDDFSFISQEIIELKPGKLAELAKADFSSWKNYSIRVRLLGHCQRRALFRAVLFTNRQIYEVPFCLEF